MNVDGVIVFVDYRSNVVQVHVSDVHVRLGRVGQIVRAEKDGHAGLAGQTAGRSQNGVLVCKWASRSRQVFIIDSYFFIDILPETELISFICIIFAD